MRTAGVFYGINKEADTYEPEEGKGSLSADIAFEHFPLNVANP